MKVAITSTGKMPGSEFDPLFGRCVCFAIVDTANSHALVFIDNKFREGSDAGIKSATLMSEMGVKKVISGDFGPKAMEALGNFDIEMVALGYANKPVSEIIRYIK